MNIIHVIWSMQLGGAEAMLIDIVEHQQLSNNVSIIVINDDVNSNFIGSINENVKLFRINRKKKSRNIFFILKLNYILKTLSPDIIHCHNHDLITLIFRYRNRCCLTVHDVSIPIKYFHLYNSLFAISLSVKRMISAQDGLNGILVYNGIEYAKIIQKTKLDRKNTLRMVQVSRLDHKKKGQDILVKAIEIVNRLINDYTIHLDLIGEGDSYDFLSDLIAKNKLENVIHLCGVKDRDFIYANLHTYDVFIQPSNWEGFGLTVAEALYAKVPTIVSNIDGPIEIIEDGKWGFKFESGNYHDLAKKIMHVAKIYNTNELQKMVRQAAEHIENTFSISRTSTNYLKQYKIILNNIKG